MSTKRKRNKVVELLAHKPASFLVFFFVGILVHQFFPIVLFSQIQVGNALGIPLLLFGTLLLVVGEYFQRKFFQPDVDPSNYNFFIGPYRVSRHPGTLGLVLMYLGFAFIFNSMILFLIVIFLFILLSFVVLPYEERLVLRMCSKKYEEYRSQVRMWL